MRMKTTSPIVLDVFTEAVLRRHWNFQYCCIHEYNVLYAWIEPHYHSISIVGLGSGSSEPGVK